MADGLLNKASIILTPTGYKAGTLYNVAPVVEPYEDFDFARASVASRVNSSGLVEMVGRTLGSELVTNGDFATDSDWNKGTGWSIADGVASCDGSQTANSLLYQSGILSIGTTFKAQLTLSNYQSGTLRFVLGGGGSEISCSSNGTFTFYGNKGADNNLYLSANSTFEGSVDNVSVKEVLAESFDDETEAETLNTNNTINTNSW